jgi:transketolase C-terminal domain/subunit
MGDRAKRFGKRVGCAGILAAAVVSLGLSVRHGVAFTSNFRSPANVRAWTINIRQEECIYQAIRKQVPEGVTAYVHGPTHPLTWKMATMSTPWLVPQEASPPTALWRLSLVHVLPHTQCDGLALKVQHL